MSSLYWSALALPTSPRLSEDYHILQIAKQTVLNYCIPPGARRALRKAGFSSLASLEYKENTAANFATGLGVSKLKLNKH